MLLRKLDDLLAELPRPAISYAVTKAWIYKAAGEGWFRVTKRAANELNLPPRSGGGDRQKGPERHVRATP